MNSTRLRRKAQGLCVDGEHPSRPGKDRCKPCAQIAVAKEQAYCVRHPERYREKVAKAYIPREPTFDAFDRHMTAMGKP